MEFDVSWSIDTIGPLTPEFLAALALAILAARGGAWVVRRLALRLKDRGRRLVYGGLLALALGGIILVLPDTLVRLLYSVRHPNAAVCSAMVGYFYFVPLLVFAYLLWAGRKGTVARTQSMGGSEGAVQ